MLVLCSELLKEEHFEVATREIFGPFQVGGADDGGWQQDHRQQQPTSVVAAAREAALVAASTSFGSSSGFGGTHTSSHSWKLAWLTFGSCVPMLSPCVAPVLQVVTQYGDRDVPHVLEACERMEAHLTAAVVSNDIAFVQRILGSTVNGTTYAGIRARTTGGCTLGDARWAALGRGQAWAC